LQAGDRSQDVEWWPWEVEGLWLDPRRPPLLKRLPPLGNHPDLADELRWWSHLQRWSLKP